MYYYLSEESPAAGSGSYCIHGIHSNFSYIRINVGIKYERRMD